ncbi:hypothetical protein ACVWZ6_001806 [Bradyrhizobium sp. GM6.1]
MLAESLRVAHEAGALRSQDIKRVTVDTTVQPKAITFPTDAKLLHAAIKGPNRLARKHGVKLRQSYLRIAKTATMMAGRYGHAKQFKRHQRQLRILRSRLGQISAVSSCKAQARKKSSRAGPWRGLSVMIHDAMAAMSSSLVAPCWPIQSSTLKPIAEARGSSTKT